MYVVTLRHVALRDETKARSAKKQTSANFLYMLAVAAARYSPDGNVICYVLPVLWITSCFHIMESIGQVQR